MSKWVLYLGILSVLHVAAARLAHADALDEGKVVELAAAHNPGLKTALLQLESARWNVTGVEAKYAAVLVLDASATQTTTPGLFIDQVSLNRTRRADSGAELRKRLIWGTDLSLRVAGYSVVTQSNVSFGATPNGRFGPGYGVLAKLTLKQPLLRGSGRDVGEADLLASRAQRTVQEHTRDRIASELLRDALTAYWELWYAEAAVEIQEQSREVAIRQRDDASARASTGALAPADVFAFDTQVATREESLLDARTLRQQRELELLQRLGLVEARPTLELSVDSIPLTSTASREVAQQRALAESAELKELQAQISLARLQSKTADDPMRARLDLDSYIQAQGLGNKDVGAAFDQFAGVGPDHALSGFVGLTYEQPLSSRNQRAQAAKARIAVAVAEEQLVQARERILSSLGQMLSRKESGEQKVVLAERTVDNAQKQLQAEQARFATGASTSLSVLQAEDAVRNARIRVARAQADLVQSVLSLQHLTGELLHRYAGLARR